MQKTLKLSIETNPLTMIIALVLILTIMLGVIIGKLVFQQPERIVYREQLQVEHHYHNSSTQTYIIGEKEMTCVGKPDSEEMMCYKVK